jgi:putative polyketide hydroxylase
VLTGTDGGVWREAAAAATREHHIQIASYAIGAAGLADHDRAFFELYEIDSDGAVLVRPDGYVAWRSQTGANDGGMLVSAIEQILSGRRK